MEVGQGLWGRVPFADGTVPGYDRAYLVVDIADGCVSVLNVSTVAGKERKLLFSSNLALVNFNPPFPKRSFVKLDSLVTIDSAIASTLKILAGGAKLNETDLTAVLEKYSNWEL